MIPIPQCDIKGAGDEVILFLHGVGGGAESWVRQLEKFSNNYTAAAWDMPGYGKSILHERMTFPLLADSLEGLLDARGWEKVHLVGHSMGGMVAQEFAVSRQNRLHSLTLASTSPAFGNSDGDFQKRFVSARLDPLDAGKTMSVLAAEILENIMAEEVDSRRRAIAYNCMSVIPGETYRSAIECIVTFEQRENLPRIFVPTLLIAGEYDKVAGTGLMKKTATKISNCQFFILPSVGHLSYIEDPDGFNAVLDNFLLTVSV